MDVYVPNAMDVYVPNTMDVYVPNTMDVYVPNAMDVYVPRRGTYQSIDGEREQGSGNRENPDTRSLSPSMD